VALLAWVSLGAVVALLAPDAVRAQSGPFLYVPNSGDSNVSVIDTPTNTTVPATIAVGNQPHGAGVSGDESFVYVSNNSSSNVSVINTATNAVVATITVGTNPAGVAVSPDGTRAYVSNGGSSNVSVINTATNTVVATITVGSNPAGVAVSPDGTRAYVSNGGSSNVSVINTATNAVVATITVGSLPTGVAVSPDGTRAYVSNGGSSNVSVINTATNTVVATIGVGSTPTNVAVSPDGTRAYASNGGSSNVSVINTATNTVVATITVGSTPRGVVVSPDGTRVYVTNENSNNVSVINTATNTVVATVTLGSNPFFPGICSNGNALLASGLTFRANTSGALACTLASGSTGSSGPVFTGGTMQFAGTGITSALPISLQAAGGTFDTSGNNATLSGTISGPGSLTKIGAGTLVLSGTSSYTGATTVNAGTLSVNGDISSSSGLTVNNGGTLGGTGTVPSVIIASGGTLAPGNSIGTITVSGNLTFNSGSTYAVEVSPTAADRTNVSGTATLAGTVQATFASGSYVAKQYTILTATGGRSGTTFSALTNTNLPAGFTDSLSYDTNDVFLNLTATLGALSTGGLAGNQQNVANALDTFFNGGGTLPPNFVTIFGLTGGALTNALSQLSGEAATDAERGAFQMMTEFLDLMLDPFVDGRNSTGRGGAIGFAPDEQASLPPDTALAYAGVLKAPPKPAMFDRRWSAWGTGFGGSNQTNGDPAAGTNNVTARNFGFAGGMDYHFTPDSVVGFALAGGGTNWGLAQGLGGGRSDAFQAGVYGITRFGPAYVAASLAFANHWMTTNRVAPLSDQLTANFNAQSYGGRIEGGYRYAVLPTIGVTPYAAVQAQSFHAPSYSESDLTGGGFGLSYSAMNATDTRSELGARFDDLTMLGTMPLILRARAAWAHDWVSNPSLTAVFQALPGAAFTVNGAAPPKNSALASVGAELHITANWSLAAKFAGEFASGSQTYAGTGTLRYMW
jgi:outer membrane autotransporter protein